MKAIDAVRAYLEMEKGKSLPTRHRRYEYSSEERVFKALFKRVKRFKFREETKTSITVWDLYFNGQYVDEFPNLKSVKCFIDEKSLEG